MNNPLLERYLRVQRLQQSSRDGLDWTDLSLSPDDAAFLGLPVNKSYPAAVLDSYVRDASIRSYGFAIPNDEAVQAIAAYGNVVEMGAGLGYWAKLLSEYVLVDAYDEAPPGPDSKSTWDFKHTKPFVDVREGSHEILRERYADSTLLLIWPPYASPFADECLRAYRGPTVAYVGEGSFGCTGDDAFHARLEKEWKLEKEVEIPQWYGIHDSLMIYRRR